MLDACAICLSEPVLLSVSFDTTLKSALENSRQKILLCFSCMEIGVGTIFFRFSLALSVVNESGQLSVISKEAENNVPCDHFYQIKNKLGGIYYENLTKWKKLFKLVT